VINQVGERWDLPVLAHGGSVHALVLWPRGVRRQLAIALPPVWPSTSCTASAPRTRWLRGSIARPARAPVNASPRPRGSSTH